MNAIVPISTSPTPRLDRWVSGRNGYWRCTNCGKSRTGGNIQVSENKWLCHVCASDNIAVGMILDTLIKAYPKTDFRITAIRRDLVINTSIKDQVLVYPNFDVSQTEVVLERVKARLDEVRRNTEWFVVWGYLMKIREIKRPAHPFRVGQIAQHVVKGSSVTVRILSLDGGKAVVRWLETGNDLNVSVNNLKPTTAIVPISEPMTITESTFRRVEKPSYRCDGCQKAAMYMVTRGNFRYCEECALPPITMPDQEEIEWLAENFVRLLGKGTAKNAIVTITAELDTFVQNVNTGFVHATKLRDDVARAQEGLRKMRNDPACVFDHPAHDTWKDQMNKFRLVEWWAQTKRDIATLSADDRAGRQEELAWVQQVNDLARSVDASGNIWDAIKHTQEYVKVASGGAYTSFGELIDAVEKHRDQPTTAIVPTGEHRHHDIVWNATNPTFFYPQINADDHVYILPTKELGTVRWVEVFDGHELYAVGSKHGLTRYIRRDISLCLYYDGIMAMPIDCKPFHPGDLVKIEFHDGYQYGYLEGYETPHWVNIKGIDGKPIGTHLQRLSHITPDELPRPITTEKASDPVIPTHCPKDRECGCGYGQCQVMDISPIATLEEARELKCGDKVTPTWGAYAGLVGTIHTMYHDEKNPEMGYLILSWDDRETSKRPGSSYKFWQVKKVQPLTEISELDEPQPNPHYHCAVCNRDLWKRLDRFNDLKNAPMMAFHPDGTVICWDCSGESGKAELPLYPTDPKRGDKVAARQTITFADKTFIPIGTPGKIESGHSFSYNVKFKGHPHTVLCLQNMLAEQKPLVTVSCNICKWVHKAPHAEALEALKQHLAVHNKPTTEEKPKRELQKGDHVRVIGYTDEIGTVTSITRYKKRPDTSYCTVSWKGGHEQNFNLHMVEPVEADPLSVPCAECGKPIGRAAVVHNKKSYCAKCGKPKLREEQDKTLFIQKLSDAPDELMPAPRVIEQPEQTVIPTKQLSLFGE